MLPVISALLAFVAGLVRSRASLCLEHLALRHQLAVYQQTVHRPRLRSTNRLLWVWLARLWPGWRDALAFVQPRTVLAWQRQRFRDYWRRLSQRGQPGRPAIPKEVRQLIREMWRANPTWGSPRIVGELRKLGIDVAKATVEKYRVRPHKPPSPTWKTFLKNHMQDLVSLDFFVVPTITHKVLFVLLILAHERRRVVHFNMTEHPTAQWTAQQVVDAFPWDEAPRYLLRDRDRVFGASFRRRVRNMGIEEVMIAPPHIELHREVCHGERQPDGRGRPPKRGPFPRGHGPGGGPALQERRRCLDQDRKPPRGGFLPWNDPEEFIESVIPQYRLDYWEHQPYAVEVWSEKSTVSGTLRPVMRRCGGSLAFEEIIEGEC